MGALLTGALAPRPAAAQVADTVLGPTLIANRSFRGSSPDTLVLALHKGGQYRIGVWPAAATLRVAVTGHADRIAFAPRVREGDVDHLTVIELYPQDNGPHRLVLTPPVGTTVVRLWVWEDSAAEGRSEATEARRWHIGLAAEAGRFNAYQVTDSEPPSGTSHFEGSIVIASSSRWSFALGFGNDSRAGAPESVNWGFIEPRYRLREGTIGGHAAEVRLAVRWEQGNATTISVDPARAGIGVLINWHLDHRRDPRGWLLGARAMISHVTNVGLPSQAVSYFGISLAWIP